MFFVTESYLRCVVSTLLGMARCARFYGGAESDIGGERTGLALFFLYIELMCLTITSARTHQRLTLHKYHNPLHFYH